MDLKIDDTTGDIVVDGDLVTVSESYEVRQYLRSKLKTFLGEWFLDLTVGVPYYEEVFKKNPDAVVIDAAFKEAILSTPGVLELMEFEMGFDNALRKLSLDFKVRSLDGPINFSEVLP